MRELAAGVTLAAAVALACFALPLWLAARPLSLRRRLLSLLCPASQVAIVALAHVAAREGAIRAASALAVAVLALACAVLDIMVVRALVEAEQADAARRQAKVAQEQRAAQSEHLRVLGREQREASKLRSRTAAMFADVAGALERGEKNRALELLEEGASAAESLVRVPCANSVAAALLSAKAARCEELGIEWRFCSELPERIGIPSVELCVLLSNLLDNAMAAAQGCKAAGQSAFVRASIRVSHGFLVADVENTYLPENAAERTPSGEDGLPEHGWGMRIVEALVRARDGELTINCADGVWTAQAIVQLD